MKKLVLSLLAVALLASPAFAKVTEFTDVTIDVPEGWQVNEQAPAVMMMSPGQDAVITVVTMPMVEGMSVEAIAQQAATASNAPAPVKDGDGYLVKMDVQGQEALTFVHRQRDRMVIVTVAGVNMNENLTIGKTTRVK